LGNINQVLRDRLIDLLSDWEISGRPTRTGFKSAAEEIIRWKKKNHISGLWEIPPLFVTATIDDGWGHGLQLIHLWAKVVGLKVQALGLLVKPEEIIRKCLRLNPDFLGMTVLQFDTEDDLILITRNLPSKTRVIVGGPIFSADPELAGRTGVHFVAKNAADFISFMLKFEPPLKQ
jgi:methylmalonyl-CoA mutase cobalamin-binding subunit